MSEETKSLLTLLALIFCSAGLTVCVVWALAAYCLRGNE
jgi:hypothetical protein